MLLSRVVAMLLPRTVPGVTGAQIIVLASIAAAATALPARSWQDAATTVGGQQLQLRAKATRSALFGTVEIYRVGVYLPREVANIDELRSPKLTKAVRVAVLYDAGMPGKVPSDWWEELVPALAPREEQKLRSAFAKLSSGEDVWITYAPDMGTRILHDGNTVVSTQKHELMNAVLDLWFGETPVSQEVHDALRAALFR